MKLYITGATPNSVKAVANIRSICEKYMEHNYKLDIIDVYQQPTVATKEQIIALPLLIKSHPFPERRLIGNMSDTEKVLKGLDLD